MSCIFLYISKESGNLLAEMAVRSGAVLVSVGYDLCPHGRPTCIDRQCYFCYSKPVSSLLL